MKFTNTYWIIAGILNLLTFLLHLIGGQLDLINPLFQSDLNAQIQTELLGAWHMVTIILFASSIIYFKYGIIKKGRESFDAIAFISYLYIAFSFAFIFSSLFNSIFAPQWILLLPIGLLGVLGIRKSKTNA